MHSGFIGNPTQGLEALIQKDVQCGDPEATQGPLPYSDINTSHLADVHAIGKSEEQGLRQPTLQFYNNPCSKTAG